MAIISENKKDIVGAVTKSPFLPKGIFYYNILFYHKEHFQKKSSTGIGFEFLKNLWLICYSFFFK